MNSFKIILVVLLSLVLLVCVVVFAVGERRAETTPDPAPEVAEYPPPTAAQDPVLDDNPVAALPDDVPASLTNTAISWGIGPSRNDKNQPTDCINAQNKYGDIGGIFLYPEDSNTIYLTFDMGYENENTAILLDKLAAYDVKGTFFVTMDYVKQAPDMVRRILDEGHTLANHTVKHRNITTLTNEELRKEIMDLHDYVADNFGYQMTLFRPPEGVFSAYTVNHIDGLGYKTVLWSFGYVDWNVNNQPSEAYAMEKTTKALCGGAIYLFHPCSATNAAIMDDFIEVAMQQGYHFGLIDRRAGTVSTVPSLI